MPTVNIPEPLRKFNQSKKTLSLSSKTLGELVLDIKKNRPEIYKQVFLTTNSLRPFIKLCINGEVVEPFEYPDLTLDEHSTIDIIVAVSGG